MDTLLSSLSFYFWNQRMKKKGKGRRKEKKEDEPPLDLAAGFAPGIDHND